MEYTLQLTDEIALQKDDLATYEGAAFTGEEYYLTVPLEHSIHIYGADFTFLRHAHVHMLMRRFAMIP